MDLHLSLDLSEIRKLNVEMDRMMPRIEAAGASLAAETHAHVLERAQRELHSRREMFVENLTFEEVEPGIWVVTVKAPAVWIDEGMPPHSMVAALLGKNAKIAKDGSRYRVIPFRHDKGGASQTPAAASLTQTIKQELKKLKVGYKSIDRDASGAPKEGLVFKHDIENKPLKPASFPFTFNKPGDNMHGYGRGPKGSVMQGPSGIPFLQGIRIYQRKMLNKDGSPKLDSAGLQKASRSVMTFRVVSSKHVAEGKWYYPGVEGKHFLDEAMTWAEHEWDTRIVPDLLKSITNDDGK